MKQESRVVPVAPFGPRGEPRQPQASLAKEGCPIHGVESVAEINFEKHLVRDAGVPLHPLSGCVDHRFCAMTGGYPNLQGTQKIPGWHPDIIAEAFGC